MHDARILVTGGAGFIGSAVIRALIRDTTYSVVNVDALTYAANLAVLQEFDGFPQYSFERGSVADRDMMGRVLAHYRPRAVIHLAAESHVDRSIDRPSDFIQTNIVGTYTLLEAARDYWPSLDPVDRAQFRFLHVSTDEVYGNAGRGALFDECSPYAPNSPYAASKASADHLVRAWHRTYGLPVVLTNCSNNYGPYQFPEKLIPHMVISALEGRQLPVYGDGLHVRDWLHVDEHAEALLTVLSRGRPGEVYAIGGRNEQQNLDVVRAVCRILDELQPQSNGRSYVDQIVFVEDRPGHDRRYALDPSKIDRELGWSASRDFEAGLRETIAWYLDNESWWSRIRSDEYRGERLGLAR